MTAHPVHPIGEVSISSQGSSRGRKGPGIWSTLAALAKEVCWRDPRSVTGEVVRHRGERLLGLPGHVRVDDPVAPVGQGLHE
jgi:hypothetical protein